MQKIPAPDSASELMCVKCQSLASPSTEEYWHIGATMMRLDRFRSRSFIGENRSLIWGIRTGREKMLATSVARRPPLLNPPPAQPSSYARGQAPRRPPPQGAKEEGFTPPA